ncbi:hypothetical protein GPECTOR_32g451 [Gonium pectorale]|uniref:Uncharacterized protein n=1 Tax=Gonium pectorale TaxID=33097 RepID=A0A150GDC8_GONPE|nr:hypothetical protein GPECTOR_32g451 [Gonium pectorale]|eukprot:KXZ47839.1 hypothetical protein GPECTOR_32g451 [Gonium pectorale]
MLSAAKADSKEGAITGSGGKAPESWALFWVMARAEIFEGGLSSHKDLHAVGALSLEQQQAAAAGGQP